MAGETILVPLDGSPNSEAALPYAIALGQATDSELKLLSVIEPVEENAIFRRVEQDVHLLQRLQSEAGHYLSQKVVALQEQGVAATSDVATGSATEEILRVAETEGASTIVMATRGRGGLQRWMVGSVADKVMRMATVPTLLVRPPEAPAAQERIELRRLLVPLDGSDLAETAIGPAAELAKAAGARLTLLRIEPWLSSKWPFATDEDMYVPNLSDLEAETEAAAREYIDGACRQVTAGVTCNGVVLRGFVSMLLEPYVEQEQIDLVVMSTRGRGGLSRFVLGSNADRLVRAGVTTLLINPAALANEDPSTEAPVSAT
jgi:nucleotide-binding universal stress UspA family protein